MKTQLNSFTYNRSEVKAGILHIGVGNFHRAHEEYFTNKLLEDVTQHQWGICGVALLPGDEHLYKTLHSQDNIYTLTVCGRDGKDEAYTVGSLVELIWGIESPEAVINKIADKSIRIITLTITEGGYNISKENGDFILSDEAIQHDIANPHTPQTVFGFVAEGLRKRIESGNGPVTILSCDNLQHNGNTARKAFTSFLLAQDAGLAEWVGRHVTFPNSMVDRITPAVTPADIDRLNQKNGTLDGAPVYCEDFIQWVIEDNFIAGRPAWERVGVEFAQDVSTYENMKLSLLNASHTLLSYPAFLSGYRRVDDAMHNETLVRYLRTFMDQDITPYVPAPGNTDLNLYKKTLIERFANRSVSDQLSRLCFDGISKIPVYIMPNFMKMLSNQADLSRLAYFVAAYRHYLKYKTDDKGNVYEINEPWITEDDFKLIASNDPADFLGLSPFSCTDLKNAEAFNSLYQRMVIEIKERGALPVLESIL